MDVLTESGKIQMIHHGDDEEEEEEEEGSDGSDEDSYIEADMDALDYNLRGISFIIYSMAIAFPVFIFLHVILYLFEVPRCT